MTVLGLTSGELFVVTFIVVAVVSAPYWPKVGGAIAVALVGKGSGGANAPGEKPDPDARAGERAG